MRLFLPIATDKFTRTAYKQRNPRKAQIAITYNNISMLFKIQRKTIDLHNEPVYHLNQNKKKQKKLFVFGKHNRVENVLLANVEDSFLVSFGNNGACNPSSLINGSSDSSISFREEI